MTKMISSHFLRSSSRSIASSGLHPTRFWALMAPMAAWTLTCSSFAQEVVWSYAGGFIDSTSLPNEFGFSVAVVPGLDGPDGVVVGAPHTTLFAGSCSDCARAGSVSFQFDSSPRLVFGDDGGDRFGFAVAAGLDLDGDATPDLIVGAPNDDDVGQDCGACVAISGATGAKLYRVFGSSAGDNLGMALAAVGDIDGDGRDDFLAGAPQVSSGGEGYARIYSGATGVLIRSHQGQASMDRYGFALLGLHDADGDGLGDYAIGAPGEAGHGRVRIHSGANGVELRVLSGNSVGGEFGASIGTGADCDRDGQLDLIVGSPAGGTGVGAAVVFSGLMGAEILRLESTAAGDWLGASVSGVQDFDGDGYGDVAVGAPGDETDGIWKSFHDAGYAAVFSGRNGVQIARLGGGAGGGAVGVSMASGNDLNGDGLDDVIVGARHNNSGYGNLGYVIAIGRAAQPVTAGPKANSRFGHSVSGVGDLDGDGLPDVVFGAPNFVDEVTGMRGLVRAVSGRSGSTIREWYGSSPDDRLGTAVAGASDLDGDGVHDVVLGSAVDRGAAGGFNEGFASAYSGADGRLLWSVSAPGEAAFGRTLSGGEDVDGDGTDDVVVGGARYHIDGGFSSPGRAQVVSGATGQAIYTYQGTGQEALGFSVALVGDLNGDGRSEFLVGAPGRPWSPPDFGFGEVDLYSGIDGSLLHTFRAQEFHSGVAVARVGDVNFDGVEDVAFSSWFTLPHGTTGTVFCHSGANFAPLWEREFQLSYQGPSLGFAMAPMGDYNGDGRGDLVVGHPGIGTQYAFSTGRVSVLSGAGGATLTSCGGYSGWDYFGYSVAGIGDANGDGIPDFAAGAPTEEGNPLLAKVGQDRVQIVLSNHLAQRNECQTSPNSSGNAAHLRAVGSNVLAHNNITLRVTGAAANELGLYFHGAGSTSTPLFDGHLCIGGLLTRMFPVVTTTPEGAVEFPVDLTAPHSAPITSGVEWSFQFYFRDSSSGLGANLSDVVRVQFAL